MEREKLLALLGPAAKAHVLKQLAAGGGNPVVQKCARKPTIRAQPVVIDGIRFPSKHEGHYYSHLVLRQRAGEILYFHRQIIFDLPGGRRLVVDFMVIYPDCRIEYIETKGYAMEDYRVKKDICEALYGIKIIEIRMN